MILLKYQTYKVKIRIVTNIKAAKPEIRYTWSLFVFFLIRRIVFRYFFSYRKVKTGAEKNRKDLINDSLLWCYNILDFYIKWFFIEDYLGKKRFWLVKDFLK